MILLCKFLRFPQQPEIGQEVYMIHKVLVTLCFTGSYIRFKQLPGRKELDCDEQPTDTHYFQELCCGRSKQSGGDNT